MVTVRDISQLLNIPSSTLINEIQANFTGAKSISEDAPISSEWTHFLLRKLVRVWPRSLIVSIAALKGGVGKTTLTLNVASFLAKLGLKVLIVDLDPEACVTNSLRVQSETDGALREPSSLVLIDILREKRPLAEAIERTHQSGLELVPSALRNHHLEKFVGHQNPKKIIKSLLEPLKDYQVIFLDLPPSFSTVTGSAYLAADLIVIPCTPNIFSLESVSLTVEAVGKLAQEFDCPIPNTKIVMNQFNQQRVAAREILALLKEKFGKKVLPEVIRDSADVVNAVNSGQDIFSVKSQQGIKDAFSRLTGAILDWH